MPLADGGDGRLKDPVTERHSPTAQATDADRSPCLARCSSSARRSASATLGPLSRLAYGGRHDAARRSSPGGRRSGPSCWRRSSLLRARRGRPIVGLAGRAAPGSCGSLVVVAGSRGCRPEPGDLRRVRADQRSPWPCSRSTPTRPSSPRSSIGDRARAVRTGFELVALATGDGRDDARRARPGIDPATGIAVDPLGLGPGAARGRLPRRCSSLVSRHGYPGVPTDEAAFAVLGGRVLGFLIVAAIVGGIGWP